METRASASKDVVLDVEASDVDCLYRVARFDGAFARVVYVTVCDSSIIPAEERTELSLILKNFRRLAGWPNQDWHTMEVLKTESGIRTEMDRTTPHALPNEILLTQMPRYSVLDVEVLGWPKHRTSRARVGERDVFMKIAPFSYQLSYLRQEVLMYQYLHGENLPFAPELLGFVYEESPDRVIGFLCQAIHGRHPSATDHKKCMDALERLHAKGVYHGDVNKYNILVTPGDEIIFIDFENSTRITASVCSDKEMAAKMQAEKQGLLASLTDESNRGRPIDMPD